MKLLKHINNIDVAIRIVWKTLNDSQTFYICKVEWWNIVNVPFFIKKEYVNINVQDMKNWKHFMEEV